MMPYDRRHVERHKSILPKREPKTFNYLIWIIIIVIIIIVILSLS